MDTQSNLGLRYYIGTKGVSQDYTESAKWLTLAAAQGDVTAQYYLGVMYDIGQSVAQDYVKAHMWYNLAAARGDKDAVKNRDTMVSVMTQQQIAEAQKLARECLARNYKGC